MAEDIEGSCRTGGVAHRSSPPRRGIAPTASLLSLHHRLVFTCPRQPPVSSLKNGGATARTFQGSNPSGSPARPTTTRAVPPGSFPMKPPHVGSAVVDTDTPTSRVRLSPRPPCVAYGRGPSPFHRTSQGHKAGVHGGIRVSLAHRRTHPGFSHAPVVRRRRSRSQYDGPG